MCPSVPPQNQHIFNTHLNYLNLGCEYRAQLTLNWAKMLWWQWYTCNKCLVLTITTFKMMGVVMRQYLCPLACKFWWEYCFSYHNKAAFCLISLSTCITSQEEVALVCEWSWILTRPPNMKLSIKLRKQMASSFHLQRKWYLRTTWKLAQFVKYQGFIFQSLEPSGKNDFKWVENRLVCNA